MKEPYMQVETGKLTLSKVASIVGASFTIQELHCSGSISDASTKEILSRCAEHVKRQGAKMEYLELMGLPRKCTPTGTRKTLFFDLLKLSKKWKIMYLDWFPHGSYLAGLSGDKPDICSATFFHWEWEWAQTISGGNIRSLFMNNGLKMVNLKALKKLWSISDQVSIPAGIVWPDNVQKIEVDGGKGDNPDAGWQRLVALHAEANGHNNNNNS